MAPTVYDSRKEALDALRPLLTAEETRSANLNARALGVISASSVVTAIAAFFAKDVLSGTSLEKLGRAEVPAILLLILAVVLLAAAVISGVVTLWPRTRFYVTPDEFDKWKLGQVQDGEAIREQTLRDLAGLLANLRQFNASKVKRLKWTYRFYAAAVAIIAIDAAVFFLAAL